MNYVRERQGLDNELIAFLSICKAGLSQTAAVTAHRHLQTATGWPLPA